MKCTQCGCEKLLLAPTPFTADFFKTSVSLKIYACTKCGHLEFFDVGIVEIHNETMSQIQALKLKQNELSQELEKQTQPILELQQEKAEIEEKLQDKDITIREHEKLDNELKPRIKEIDNEINKLLRTINPLKKELQTLIEEISQLNKKDFCSEYEKRFFLIR